MSRRGSWRALPLAVALGLSGPFAAWSAHPLITEDTGTQGTGRAQLELTSEHFVSNKATGAHQHLALSTVVATYGFVDSADLVLTLPHLRTGDSAPDGQAGAHGLADVGLDIKWRFYEDGPLSLAVKPGVTFPTGDDDRSLGTGRANWSAYVVTGYEVARWHLHLHLGHVHVNNTSNARVNRWHASAAAVYAASALKLIVDAGIDTDEDRAHQRHPVFLVTGAIYSPHPDLDVDLGLRWEEGDQAHARVLLAGLTFRW
jgi:hypothetical protein